MVESAQNQLSQLDLNQQNENPHHHNHNFSKHGDDPMVIDANYYNDLPSCGHSHGLIPSIHLKDLADHYEISQNGQMPQACDIKEALIAKLTQLDLRIYQLHKSNIEIAKELAGDPEMPEYIRENEVVIVKTKDELQTILNAFLAFKHL